MATAVALFTADLRVHDNPVLRAALDSADEVVPLFVLDEGVRAAGFASPNRSAFLTDSLAALDEALRAAGGRLVVRRGRVVPEVCRVVREAGARHVHVAAGVSGYALRREQRLRAELAGLRCPLTVHEGSLTVVAPGMVTPAGRDHFSVFTPYLRQWERAALRDPLAAPRRVRVPAGLPSAGLPTHPAGTSPGLPEGGEAAGRRRLARWLRGALAGYADHRDDLAGDATSRLSPYLHFGCVSPLETVRRARRTGVAGAEAFVRQLAWRDFHCQMLHARPDAASADYRPRGDRWRDDEAEFAAWREGRTGYPVVDAGMRQLAGEGWMHNRARLITASFLAKTLYLDWRLGARHFLDLLVDGDIANNQLNWQWVAGTGADTRPGRVLNPLAQGRRFDPAGDYVRRWVPELSGIAGPAVHEPWRLGPGLAPDYPPPLVDLREGLARFRRARGRF